MNSGKKILFSVLLTLVISNFSFAEEQAQEYILTLTDQQKQELIALLEDTELLEEIKSENRIAALPMIPIVGSKR